MRVVLFFSLLVAACHAAMPSCDSLLQLSDEDIARLLVSRTKRLVKQVRRVRKLTCLDKQRRRRLVSLLFSARVLGRSSVKRTKRTSRRRRGRRSSTGRRRRRVTCRSARKALRSIVRFSCGKKVTRKCVRRVRRWIRHRKNRKSFRALRFALKCRRRRRRPTGGRPRSSGGRSASLSADAIASIVMSSGSTSSSRSSSSSSSSSGSSSGASRRSSGRRASARRKRRRLSRRLRLVQCQRAAAKFLVWAKTNLTTACPSGDCSGGVLGVRKWNSKWRKVLKRCGKRRTRVVLVSRAAALAAAAAALTGRSASEAANTGRAVWEIVLVVLMGVFILALVAAVIVQAVFIHRKLKSKSTLSGQSISSETGASQGLLSSV